MSSDTKARLVLIAMSGYSIGFGGILLSKLSVIGAILFCSGMGIILGIFIANTFPLKKKPTTRDTER